MNEKMSLVYPFFLQNLGKNEIFEWGGGGGGGSQADGLWHCSVPIGSGCVQQDDSTAWYLLVVCHVNPSRKVMTMGWQPLVSISPNVVIVVLTCSDKHLVRQLIEATQLRNYCQFLLESLPWLGAELSPVGAVLLWCPVYCWFCSWSDGGAI